MQDDGNNESWEQWQGRGGPGGYKRLDKHELILCSVHQEICKTFADANLGPSPTTQREQLRQLSIQ